MMNCLTTRSTLLADPTVRHADLSAHLTLCPACRAFAAAIAQGECLLRDAIDVPVPEHLQERILLQTQLKRRQSSWLSRLRDWVNRISVVHRSAIVVAFSAVLAVTIWSAQPSLQRGMNWGEVALAHVIGEPSALASKGALPHVALRDALAPYGLALNGELGITRFLEYCAVPGGRAIHVVIDTRELGKVTLLIPPSGMPVSGGEARGEGFSARIVAVGGVSLGIVTDRPDQLPALAALISRQIVKNA